MELLLIQAGDQAVFAAFGMQALMIVAGLVVVILGVVVLLKMKDRPPQDEGEIEVSYNDKRVRLFNLAPGLVIAILGAAIMGLGITHKPPLEQLLAEREEAKEKLDTSQEKKNRLEAMLAEKKKAGTLTPTKRKELLTKIDLEKKSIKTYSQKLTTLNRRISTLKVQPRTLKPIKPDSSGVR